MTYNLRLFAAENCLFEVYLKDIQLHITQVAQGIYLTENGGGRSAQIQPRPRARVSEGAGQNSLAGTRRNSNVTDKPRSNDD